MDKCVFWTHKYMQLVKWFDFIYFCSYPQVILTWNGIDQIKSCKIRPINSLRHYSLTPKPVCVGSKASRGGALHWAGALSLPLATVFLWCAGGRNWPLTCLTRKAGENEDRLGTTSDIKGGMRRPTPWQTGRLKALGISHCSELAATLAPQMGLRQRYKDINQD